MITGILEHVGILMGIFYWGFQTNNSDELYIYICLLYRYICSLLHKQGCSQHPGYVWEVKLGIYIFIFALVAIMYCTYQRLRQPF